MNALRAGAAPPPPDPRVAAIGAAMLQDADVFRGMIEVITCLALPQEVFTRPALQAKISEHMNESADEHPGAEPRRAPGARALTATATHGRSRAKFE